MSTTDSKNSQVFSFGQENFSAYLPIDIKPVFGRNWVTNGINNIGFKFYQNAFDDSPTNNSIISAKASYVFGDGLVDLLGKDISSIISEEDVNLAILDLEKFGGCSLQIIWSLAKKPLRAKYIPIAKLGVNYDRESIEVNGYWYSYDWSNRLRYRPELYPVFTGEYQGNGLEVLYIRKPTSETFFPVPSWLSGMRWAQIEGQIANGGFEFFENSVQELTVINYNDGQMDSKAQAESEANVVREKLTGSRNRGKVIVAFNESMESAVTVDRIAPTDMSQHNVFYSEEAERKLIVAHSAPPILFQGSNQGAGFSSNADEMAIAMQGLYRRHINPSRKVFLLGLSKVFKAIGEYNIEFLNFKNEDNLENNSAGTLDKKTLLSQANLKGGTGGVQALLDIQASYAQGLTTYDSAINMLDIIFGYSRETAVRLLGTPEIK